VQEDPVSIEEEKINEKIFEVKAEPIE